MCFIHVDLFNIIRFVLPQLPTGDTAKTFSTQLFTISSRQIQKASIIWITTNAGSQPDALVHNAKVSKKEKTYPRISAGFYFQPHVLVQKSLVPLTKMTPWVKGKVTNFQNLYYIL